MRRLTLILAIIVAPVLPACGGVLDALRSPITEPTGEPYEHTLPDGSTIMVTPGVVTEPTVGSTIAGTLGGMAGAMLGIPVLGALAAGAASAVLKKKE